MMPRAADQAVSSPAKMRPQSFLMLITVQAR